MKSTSSFGLMAVTVLLTLTGIGHAQSITNLGEIDGASTMPGSLSDFSFYGNPSNFPNDSYYYPGTGAGGGAQGSQLLDFQESEGDFQYIDGGQPENFSSISVPTGTIPQQTGALFGGNSNPAYGGNNTEFDAVNYKLIDGGTGFTPGSFNVYVMYSANYGSGASGFFDSAITLTLVNAGGSILSVQPVNETNQFLTHSADGSASVADFAEFNVTGAVLGDTIEVGYVGGDGRYGDISGISFVSAAPMPEPSTYAMIIAGLGLLAFGLRLSRNRAALKI